MFFKSIRNLQQFGKRVIITFDRYEDAQDDIKNAEHIRDRKLSSSDYDIQHQYSCSNFAVGFPGEWL